eukprot:gene26502-biopygen16693
MKSCHEQGVCGRNRAGIEAADPAPTMPIPLQSQKR